MPIAEQYPQDSSCSGQPAEFGQLSEVQDRIEAFLRGALPEIIGGLTGWHAGRSSPRPEKGIAADLCNYLNFAANGRQVFRFQNEDPQNPSATRTVDMAGYPSVFLQVADRTLGPLNRLYAIEAKRLPPPDRTGEDRSREYVVGMWKQKYNPRKLRTGGIERFKEGDHGADLNRAAMVGFVQRKDFEHWHGAINGWIDELIGPLIPSHTASWAQQDRLTALASPGPSVAEFCSDHARNGNSPIRLAHFWLDLTSS